MYDNSNEETLTNTDMIFIFNKGEALEYLYSKENVLKRNLHEDDVFGAIDDNKVKTKIVAVKKSQFIVSWLSVDLR